MHEIVREERPRERLKQKGAKALSVTELLTILIGSGTRSASALEIASLLTSREMDLDQLARVTRIEELTHVKAQLGLRSLSLPLNWAVALRKKQAAKETGSDVPAMPPVWLWNGFAMK